MTLLPHFVLIVRVCESAGVVSGASLFKRTISQVSSTLVIILHGDFKLYPNRPMI